MVGKCKENPDVHTKAQGCFQAGDFKIQPRTQKIYLSLFLRKFIDGEFKQSKGINPRNRKTWNSGHK